LIYSLTPTLNSFGDLSWNNATPTGLAVIEINLAAVCAALPIFWPVLKEKWGRITVTYEVRVTSEDGKYTRPWNLPSQVRDEPPEKIELAESPRAVMRSSSEGGYWNPEATLKV
jgi:hypothetical protein